MFFGFILLLLAELSSSSFENNFSAGIHDISCTGNVKVLQKWFRPNHMEVLIL